MPSEAMRRATPAELRGARCMWVYDDDPTFGAKPNKTRGFRYGKRCTRPPVFVTRTGLVGGRARFYCALHAWRILKRQGQERTLEAVGLAPQNRLRERFEIIDPAPEAKKTRGGRARSIKTRTSKT